MNARTVPIVGLALVFASTPQLVQGVSQAATSAETDNSGLPPGAIQKGSLANQKLIADTRAGVTQHSQ